MKIGLVQTQLDWENVEENLRRFDEKLLQCKGVDVVVLPEMFTSGFTMAGKEKVASFYEQTVTRMQGWAKETDVLVIGSVICKEDGRYYNRLLAAFPDGRYQYYDKRHCFTMGGEKEHFTPGNRHLIIEYKGVKIATYICYDLRFPVWSRNVQGYDMAVYVANWPQVRRGVWDTLLRARAVENQAFVIGVNCVGEDGCKLKYSGGSVVVDAKGEVLAGCEDYKEEIKHTDIDIEWLRDFRKKFPVLEDRDDFKLRG